MNTVRLHGESLWAATEDILKIALTPVPCFFLAASILLQFFLRISRQNDPALNSRKSFELTSTRTKHEFYSNAHRLLREWFTTYPDRTVVLNADVGPVTVLPPSMANEIRNDDRLSFARYTLNVRF
jgi:hypothetical protein